MTAFYIMIAVIPVAAITGLFIYAVKQRSKGIPGKKIVISNLISFAIVLAAVGALTFSVAAADTSETAQADASAQTSQSQSVSASDKGMAYIAAAVVTGLSGVGGGIAVAAGAPAAIAATSEDQKAFGKALIFVALGESIALYGVVISILILNKV